MLRSTSLFSQSSEVFFICPPFLCYHSFIRHDDHRLDDDVLEGAHEY